MWCAALLLAACGSDAPPFSAYAGTDSTGAAGADFGSGLDVDAVDTASDLQPDVAPAATAESGCDLLCSEPVRASLSSCFEDGEPISESDCQSICAEDSLAEIAECAAAAGADCGALDECFVDPDIPLVEFEVDGTDAYMNGVIDFRTIAAVEALIEDHPEVIRIVLEDCPGSMDDESNLVASRLVREAGLNTHVGADGEIASGAVDFFVAGVERSADVEGGALIGVHSWDSPEGAGDELGVVPTPQRARMGAAKVPSTPTP